VLPPRGATTKGDQRLWLVRKFVKDGDKRLAELECLDESTEQSTAPLDDLIVVVYWFSVNWNFASQSLV